MNSNGTLNLFDLADREGFLASVRAQWGDRATIAEQVNHSRITGADINTYLADNPQPVKPYLIAGNSADAGSILRQTQNPRLDGKGKQAGDTRVFVGGVYIELGIDDSALTLPELPAADSAMAVSAAALAAVGGDIDAFERSYHQLFNGSVKRLELPGAALACLGPSRALQALYDGNGAPYAGGQLLSKDLRIVQLQPFEIGVDQTTEWSMWLPLRTWSAALTIDVCLWTLTATVT